MKYRSGPLFFKVSHKTALRASTKPTSYAIKMSPIYNTNLYVQAANVSTRNRKILENGLLLTVHSLEIRFRGYIIKVASTLAFGQMNFFHLFLSIQAALVICGLFIWDFSYMRSRNDLFSGTYPLTISHPWSFYIRIHYMRVYLQSPYLSHIMRSNCIL